MLRSIYTAAFGMIHSQTKQDVTANNIANANTTGYKEDKVVTRPFPEVMLQNMDAPSVDGLPKRQELGDMTFGVEAGEVYTNFAQGPVEKSDSNLDVAINGRGFFTIGYPDGSRYTRDGSFRLDIFQRLTTQDGGYLLGTNLNTGAVEPVTLGQGEVHINSEGIVSVDNVDKYKLQIVDFGDYNGVEKLGRNLYAPIDGNVQPIEASGYEIKQGYLERSNVDITGELTDMIINARSFQANQRVLTAIDETLGKTVNEVGALR